MLHRPKQNFDPIVTDVSLDKWGYQTVTISPWPGVRMIITLSSGALDRETAEVRALEQWDIISPLILGGSA